MITDFLKKIFNFTSSNIRTGILFFLGGESKAINIEKLYTGLVFRCVDLIASKVSSVKLYEVNQKNERVDNEKFLPFLDLKPYGLSREEVIYIITSHLLIYGRSILKKEKGQLTGKFRYLIPLNPSKIIMELKNNQLIYKLLTNNGTEELTNEDILDIKIPNPFNIYQGLSTIEAARLEIETDYTSIETTRKLMENGAVPSGILSTEKTLNEENFKRLQNEIKESFSGLENFYKPMLLEGGLKWETIAIPPKDLEFIEKRKFTRDQILAIFKVPKAVLFATDVNRANSEAAKYWFSEYTIKPYVDLIVNKFNDLNIELKNNTKIVYEDFIPEDKEFNLKMYINLVNTVLTPNEVRQRLGLEPIEGGDTLSNPDFAFKSITKRTSRHNNFINKRDNFLIRKENELKNETKLIYKTFLKRLSNKKELLNIEEVINLLREDLETLKEDFRGSLGKRMIETAEKVNEHLNQIYGIKIDFDLENSGAVSFLNKNASESALNIANTLLKEIRKIIADEIAVNKKPTLKKIIERLDNEIGEMIDWKSELIARTELIKAYNYAENEIIKNSRMIEKKKWITANDDRVCPICRELNGMVVEKWQDFKGYQYQAHPQCRCAIVPEW